MGWVFRFCARCYRFFIVLAARRLTSLAGDAITFSLVAYGRCPALSRQGAKHPLRPRRASPGYPSRRRFRRRTALAAT